VSTGGRRANRERGSITSTSLPYVLALLLGAVLSGIAWVYLVRAAIEFGRLARDGQTEAWLYTLAASFGAVVCLFLLLVLVARALRAMGVIRDDQPRGTGTHRRTD
jgi:hypothetical protein